jgi:hypothetical protein
MKMLGIFLLVLSFFKAHAAFNEFECQFLAQDNKRVFLEVERGFGGSSARNARMSVTNPSSGTVEVRSFFVSARHNRGFNQIEFFGADFNLQIDLWPDQRPRWGRTYNSDFRSWSLDEGRNYFNINCEYTHI